jgi:Lrp/AsnC family leucine-responsive transcriptional regulator
MLPYRSKEGGGMDEIDIQILKVLQDDGRASHEEIGRRLNLSRPTIHQRVKRLEADGVIKKYQALVDWSKLGQTINVFILLKGIKCKEATGKIMDITIPGLDVEECCTIAGEWCMIIKVRANSTQNIAAFLDALWGLGGATETNIIFILSNVPE